MTGRHHTAESRAKMSAAKMGQRHPVSEATKAKIRATLQGRPGHPHSPEAKAKMSAVKKGIRGELTPSWKGGRVRTNGYVRKFAPDHPFATKGYVLEHRLVMAAHLGRLLRPEEIVHHINKDRTDNRIENLKLLPSHREHKIEHLNERKS